MAKTARMDLRLHEDDDALIRRAANLLHESVNAFVARAARREAEQVLYERRFAVLDADEFDELVERLDRSPAPPARLATFLAEPDPWPDQAGSGPAGASG